jgi:hypothetical protein
LITEQRKQEVMLTVAKLQKRLMVAQKVGWLLAHYRIAKVTQESEYMYIL